MTHDSDRGTGRTTRQMQDAPRAAVFVWVNDHLDYPKQLAEKLGRADLEIVRPHWLSGGYWAGRELTGLVMDHAITMNNALFDGYQRAITRVRKVDAEVSV